MRLRCRLGALFYRAWGRLPAWAQDTLVYLGAPKSTFGVSAIILDHEGRLLLVRHTYGNPAWYTPGGLIGRQEQPDVALARELREELGLEATVGAVVRVQHETYRRHVTVYYRVTVTGPPCPNGVEVDAHRYVAPAALPDLMDSASAKLLQAMLESARRDRPDGEC